MLERFDMKKWKIAQKKMAWQVKGVTGDRNIGGHTARIPDGFYFIDGTGPKGIGIDLTDKGQINKLAEAIIPQKTISKKDKICSDLEDKWMEHHGTNSTRSNSSASNLGTNLERVSRINLQECKPTEGSNFGTFLDRSCVRESPLCKMVGQMQNTPNSDKPPETVSDKQKPNVAQNKVAKSMLLGKLTNESESMLDSASSNAPKLKKSDLSTKTVIPVNIRPKPIKTLTPQPPKTKSKNTKLSGSSSDTNIVTFPNPKPSEKRRKSEFKKRTPNNKHTQPLINVPSKRPAHKTTTEPKAGSEKPATDSGLSLDNSTNKSSANVFEIPPKTIRRASSERIVSISELQSASLIKTRSESDMAGKINLNEKSDLSAVPENALLWLTRGKSRGSSQLDLLNRKSKLKRSHQSTDFLSQSTKNKDSMPQNDMYYTPINKDGNYQSFTRRRTKGLMYESLETVSYSEFYRLRSPSPLGLSFKTPGSYINPSNNFISTLSRLKSVTGNLTLSTAFM